MEASLAFPVFFYAVMALCCLFLYVETRVAVSKSMTEVARNISIYGDLIEAAEGRVAKAGLVGDVAADILEGISAEILMGNELKKHPVAVNAIKDGVNGISLTDSELMTADSCIRLVCKYILKSPVAILGIRGPEIEQRAEYRYFSGRKVSCLLEEEDDSEDAEEAEETVYKTQTGTVYHTKLTCPSLKLNISEIRSSDVGTKRNDNGGRYYPCEKCASGNLPENIFITTDGDRYHYKINCSGLKRTIIEIKRSEIGDLRPCKRCGDHEN